MDAAALLVCPGRGIKGDLVQFLPSSQFRHRVCLMLTSIPPVFGLFACVRLPEQEHLSGSHKGVTHQVPAPVFHVFPHFSHSEV